MMRCTRTILRDVFLNLLNDPENTLPLGNHRCFGREIAEAILPTAIGALLKLLNLRGASGWVRRVVEHERIASPATFYSRSR
jgi:hypothetical protein